MAKRGRLPEGENLKHLKLRQIAIDKANDLYLKESLAEKTKREKREYRLSILPKDLRCPNCFKVQNGTKHFLYAETISMFLCRKCKLRHYPSANQYRDQCHQ